MRTSRKTKEELRKDTGNKETVYAPIDMGGRNLLDIIARNEAITATWLRSYLNLAPSRPLWGFAADELIALGIESQLKMTVDKNVRTCIFLQAWDTGKSLKPKDLIEMLHVARKRGVQMEGLAFSREIMREATIWYHIKSTARRDAFSRGEEIKCFKANHNIRTMGDTEILAWRLTNANHHGRWEDEGFHNTINGHLIQVTAARIRERKAPTTFEWVKGHSGIEGNERADVLADEGRLKDEAPIVDYNITREYLVPGVKLRNITQSLAYKIIREQTMDKPSYQEALDRRTTTRNMTYTQDAAADGGDEIPAEVQVWKSIRHQDISRSIRYFLWMTLHDGYALGEYWDNFPPPYRDWGTCKKCNVPENMTHILTQCEENGQKTIWELMSELWKLKTGNDTPPPSHGGNHGLRPY
ncbi:hypothetical protein C8R44DRAFT_873674 [Mycena epipterygia]|nr:hypothetical protein C8R44DRAFT_873674 [Mycena epipterygia]